jgi:hypothetical protein
VSLLALGELSRSNTSLAQDSIVFSQDTRRPNVSVGRKLKLGRHYANHDVRLTIQCQFLPQQILITAEAPLPKSVANNYYALTSLLIVLGR